MRSPFFGASYEDDMYILFDTKNCVNIIFIEKRRKTPGFSPGEYVNKE